MVERRTLDPRIELSNPIAVGKRFAYILWKGVFFLASGQGGSSPVLPFRPWLRKANPLESLKVGYWGRITTDNPSLRDRVYDQRVK